MSPAHAPAGTEMGLGIDPNIPPDIGPEFAGRVALVSGAAQGIGWAVAQALARGGARVALLDCQHEAVHTAAQTLATRMGPHAHPLAQNTLALSADVRDRAAVHAAVEHTEATLGPIDILVNAAGVLRLGQALDTSEADWAHSFGVNTHGVIHLCSAVAAHMQTRRRGSIVTVGSNAARTPRIGMAAYCAAKAASAQFMRCLALELAPHGIRCNTVSPGSTDTAMQRQLWQHPNAAAAVIAGDAAQFRLGIPLARMATADDVAQAVCFLASERARHITMHDLRVDGGATFDL